MATHGLCCGTVLQADLFGLAEAASAAGFEAITIWPTLFTAAVEAGHPPQEIRGRLDDLGVRAIELDPCGTWLPVEVAATSLTARFAAYSVDDFFAMAAQLGCDGINAIRADDEPISDEVMIDHLGTFADRAATEGLAVYLEFLPWSPVADLGHALRLVDAVGRPNCGVHIDVWHHVRSGGTIDDLATIDPGLVGAVQLSDLDPEPWDDLVAETMSGRCLPGEGDGSAAAAMAALTAAGVPDDVPMNLEVFSRQLMGLDPTAAARRAAASLAALAAPGR